MKNVTYEWERNFLSEKALWCGNRFDAMERWVKRDTATVVFRDLAGVLRKNFLT